jgi:hypothetical protein
MFRAVHEQESNGSIQAFQPFAAGLQSDPPAPCLLSLGVTASEGPQGTALDSSSPTHLQQFVYMANSLVELLETAKRELKGNHETAKAFAA